MSESGQQAAPVKTKAVLVDPASMRVVWMNEAAEADVPDLDASAAGGLPVATAVPMAEMMGVTAVLSEVATDGEPRHLQTRLVATSKGGLAIVTSVYRLPDGKLLLLTDNAFQLAERASSGGVPRRRSR